MFDVSALELLVIVVVMVVVIGPKDLPVAMRTAGRFIGKVRRVSAHFRSGIDTMVREAELEEMEKKWKAQNEEIMRRSAGAPEVGAGPAVSLMSGPPAAAAESAAAPRAAMVTVGGIAPDVLAAQQAAAEAEAAAAAAPPPLPAAAPDAVTSPVPPAADPARDAADV